MAYKRSPRRQRKRVRAQRRGKTLPHPRIDGRPSRTTRRARTKTNRIPGWHPAAGKGGSPDYKYPGFYPGRLKKEDVGR